MKKLLISLGLLAVSALGSFAQVHVNGYYRSNGTYVEPHWRSSPNNTTSDNYSVIGNPYKR